MQTWGALAPTAPSPARALMDQLRMGVEEQFIFSLCLSPGRVKKLQKCINFCLIVGHIANLKHSKSTGRQSSCVSCEMNKISTLRNEERSTTAVVLISGAFVWSRQIYERCVHPSDKFAYRGANNNLFLTLREIHRLKQALFSTQDQYPDTESIEIPILKP